MLHVRYISFNTGEIECSDCNCVSFKIMDVERRVIIKSVYIILCWSLGNLKKYFNKTFNFNLK